MVGLDYQTGSFRQKCPEREVLKLCARQRGIESCADQVKALCRQEKFRWEALYRAAVYHHIASLVLANLLKIGVVAECMPPGVARRWKQFRTRNVLAKKNQVRMIRKIVDFFARRAGRVMLVKGAALDVAVYDEPGLTEAADLDLLVDLPFGKLNSADVAALEAMVLGWPVELDFARHHDVDMNRVLDIDYARLWADAQAVPVGESQAYLMSPEDMLLTACINLCRKRYGQLKGLVAVQELVRTYPNLDWEKVAAKARACGASLIVYTSFTITALMLGTAIPPQALAALRINFARRWAITKLSRSFSAYLIQIPPPPREPVAGLVAAYLLRTASYSLSQYRREVQGLLSLRHYRAIGSPRLTAGHYGPHHSQVHEPPTPMSCRGEHM